MGIIRLELLFWIDAASDKIMQSNLDGSQPTEILNQQSHSCLSNSYLVLQGIQCHTK
jgi:hypothetical protein